MMHIWRPAALAVLLAATATTFGCSQKKAGDTVTVAVNLPLSGPVASFSGEIPSALRLGLASGARERGLSPGSFVVAAMDNQSDPKLAISSFAAQAAASYDVYVSGLSTCSVPLFRKIEASAELSARPHYLFAFERDITAGHQSRHRLLPSYRQEGPALARAALALAPKKIAIANIDIAATNDEMAQLVEPALKGTPFVRERFPIAIGDYKTLAAKLTASGADTFIIGALAFNIRGLVAELRNRGVAPERIVVGLDGIDLLYGSSPEPVVDGVSVIAPPFELDDSQKKLDWQESARKAGITRPSYVQAYAFDLGRMIAGAKGGGIAGDHRLTPDRDLDVALVHAVISGGKLKRFI